MIKHTIQSNLSLRNGWRQAGVMLFLLVILQAAYLCDTKGDLGKSIIPSFESSDRLLADIKDSKDISRMRDRTTILHVAVRDAVETDKLEKLQVVLDRIKEDIKTGDSIKYQNAFPNSVDKTKWTPLGEAIKGGKLQVVKDLAEVESSLTHLTKKKLIDINKVGHGLTALLLALKKKHSDIVKYLLDCNEIDITTLDPGTGESPLHIAIQRQFEKVVETLVVKLIENDNKDALLVKDEKKMTPLDLAALYNNRAAFEMLFEGIREKFPEKGIQELFFTREDPKAPSLFALAYLPVPSSSSWTLADVIIAMISDTDDADDYNYKMKMNADMFQSVLDTVKDSLKKEDWHKISNEIGQLEAARKLKPEYAATLRGIVKAAKAAKEIKGAKKDKDEEKPLMFFDEE